LVRRSEQHEDNVFKGTNMLGHGTERIGNTRLGAIAAAVVMAFGIAACDTANDPADNRGIDPDPQVGTRTDDIDIGSRSTEQTRAAQNQAATDSTSLAGADRDTASLELDDGLEPGSEQIAALGSSAVSAFAVLEPTEGNEARGDASFIQVQDGLEIVVTLTGLAPGQHGIHVHENADCSNGGSAAGDHYNPDGAEHGAPADGPMMRHAGDLGNISADESGEAQLNMTIEDLEIEGARGVVGRALIVHSGEDDFTSQPDGDAGDPVACGVIEARARG
jgi:superoxide dismutase, Cu-Zn family